MDHQHLSAPSRAQNGHHRRPIAAGFLRRAPQPQHDEQQRRAHALPAPGTPTPTPTACGNRWKFGKDECARTRGHIGPHRTTEMIEAHSFHWFDSEGVPSESTPTALAPARRLVAAGYARRAPQPQPAAFLPQQDETLRQARAQALADARPSHAAALLAAIADQIGDRRTSHQAFTGDLWLRACSTAVRRTLNGLCEHTANNAVVIALTARPAPRPGETNGEYALRLRAAARGL